MLRNNTEAYLRRTGQTSTPDAGATARGAIAITRNGLEAANGIHIRELKQRDASRVEAAEVKSSLEALPSDARSSEGMLSYRSACPEFKDGLGIHMTMKKSLTFRTE